MVMTTAFALNAVETRICPVCFVILNNGFWSYKEDLKKHRLDPVFLSRYRNKLFPYLIECYMMHEPSIACFAGVFYKIYADDGNVYRDIRLYDLDVKL